MKKLLAMTLAVAMVLSLAAVSFASSDVKLDYMLDRGIFGEPCYYDSDDDARVVKYKDGYVFEYGETIYLPLIGTEITEDGKAGTVKTLISKSNAVDGLKVKTSFDFGEKYVDSVKITQKKIDTSVYDAVDGAVKPAKLEVGKSYVYFVAVKLKDTLKTDATDVIGELQFDKSATRNKAIDPNGKYDDEFDYKKDTKNFGFEVKYAAPDKDVDVVTDDRQLFKFSDLDDDEYEIALIDSDIATFTFDARGQKDMVLAANDDFNGAISAKYPTANLEFLNVEASDSFNKLGTLRVYAEEGYYLYALNENGEIVNAKAKYDKDDECYVMRTRTLGSFVLSDEELVAEAPVVPEVKPENKPFNPGTGAAC